jgi:hypothetical protein
MQLSIQSQLENTISETPDAVSRWIHMYATPNERLVMSALTKLDNTRCDLQEVWDDPSPEEMSTYIAAAQPVIFRGMARRRFPAFRKALSAKEFLNSFQNSSVKLSTIPYADSFTDEENSYKTLSMGEWVSSWFDSSHEQHSRISVKNPPMYMFSTQFANENPSLQQAFSQVFDFARKIPHASFNYDPQFYLGDAGSGAPHHWHGSAINTLAWGKKRWAIFRPDTAAYDIKPAFPFFIQNVVEAAKTDSGNNVSNEYQESAGQDKMFSTALHCVQNAGDVIIVPYWYGHATLNLQPSIGVADEMEISSNLMSFQFVVQDNLKDSTRHFKEPRSRPFSADGSATSTLHHQTKKENHRPTRRRTKSGTDVTAGKSQYVYQQLRNR